jgi:hypothetical protein
MSDSFHNEVILLPPDTSQLKKRKKVNFISFESDQGEGPSTESFLKALSHEEMRGFKPGLFNS